MHNTQHASVCTRVQLQLPAAKKSNVHRGDHAGPQLLIGSPKPIALRLSPLAYHVSPTASSPQLPAYSPQPETP